MPSSNRVKGRIGINRVASLVEGIWECGWQEYAPQNDDAFDGVIILRRGKKRPVDTGGLVFVQVKCGGDGYRQDQKQYPDHICVALGSEYIAAHRERWQVSPGPAVLVFVDDTINRETPPAWWVNLKDQASYSPTNAGMILLPKNQQFSHHTKGNFHKLCGYGPQDRKLQQIKLTRAETIIPQLGKSESIRNDAWNFYKNWRADPIACTNPILGLILVNRVGWKHITRPGRFPERILQSWTLLGAAQKIVRGSGQIFNLGHAKTITLRDGNLYTVEYLGLRAVVVFPHRHHAVVQVVLKRSRLVSPGNTHAERDKVWFYSVYELRRASQQL